MKTIHVGGINGIIEVTVEISNPGNGSIKIKATDVPTARQICGTLQGGMAFAVADGELAPTFNTVINNWVVTMRGNLSDALNLICMKTMLPPQVIDEIGAFIKPHFRWPPQSWIQSNDFLPSPHLESLKQTLDPIYWRLLNAAITNDKPQIKLCIRQMLINFGINPTELLVS